MKNQIQHILIQVLKEMGITDIIPEVEISGDPKNGDYTTNVALRLAKVLKKSPMDIALQVVREVKREKEKGQGKTLDQNIYEANQKRSAGNENFKVLQDIEKIEVAPPGFINFFLSEAKLINNLNRVLKEKESFGKRQATSFGKTQDKRVMVEFAHPNTHKAFHIGHLRNITTGESIVRLLESQGHEVIRVNYQGDVGMHIAKCLYGILRVKSQKSKVQSWKDARRLNINDRIEYLGQMYAAGSKAFEEDPEAKEEIIDLNALVYASAQRFAKEEGLDSGTTDYLDLVKHTKYSLDEIYELWKETRQWSLDYFETIYARVGSHYDRYYFESECLAGVDKAKAAIPKGVLKESEGAIIFDGKPYSIDTRVFVNSLGLPTYEAKELALAEMETSEFGKLEKLIHVVGPEQASFFKVTFKVEELLGIVEPEVQEHLIYGWVKLKHGKMSSRSGIVILGEWLLDEAKKAIYIILQNSASKTRSISKYPNQKDIEKVSPFQAKFSTQEIEEIAETAAIAAVKYSFLRVSTQNEIAFDLNESVNMDGDSGPYLQYTYARARSVLRKAGDSSCQLSAVSCQLNTEERAVLRLIMYFPEIVEDAARNFAPSGLCTYLFSLAQTFNVFYAKHSILGGGSYQPEKMVKQAESEKLRAESSQSVLRITLTSATAQVLKNGLYLLGIETLEEM